MNQCSNKVTRLPLTALSDPVTGQALQMQGWLNVDQIRELLRTSKVRFVVADIGSPLQWVDLDRCFDFFKLEVRPHLAETDAFFLADFPGEYAYAASLWSGAADVPIVVLEKSH